jgi:hypothetical protein
MTADTRSEDTPLPERGCYPSILGRKVSLSEELQALASAKVQVLILAEWRPTGFLEAGLWAMAVP